MPLLWQRWVVTLDCKCSWRKVWGDESVDHDWHPGHTDVCMCQNSSNCKIKMDVFYVYTFCHSTFDINEWMK